MTIERASAADLEPAVSCWAAAFPQDPITGFLLQAGPGYDQRLKQFFSLLMRARLALAMPVLVARANGRIQGGAMGYTTERLDWPEDVQTEWDHFEKATPGLTERLAFYEEIANQSMPSAPHYYLGVIGTEPATHGQGLGNRLLQAFCALSAGDRHSSGIYLETANPANVSFYERAGFVETGRRRLGEATLRCMFLQQRRGDR